MAAAPDAWETVVRKLRTGAMPPPGMPRPDDATLSAVLTSLTTALDRAATPNPGRPLLHRLNRAEYANVVRDLLAIDVDVRSLLPADDSAFGFDNNADLLVVSPSLLERYLSAADRVSALAVGDPDDRAGLGHVLHARAISRRASTSRACRSAPSAASACATRSRSTASTSSRSR